MRSRRTSKVIQPPRSSCEAGPVDGFDSLLKQLEDLSDWKVTRRWVDIPYWQYLSGETHFQWKPPAASSD